MKALKVLAVVLLATFAYSAADAQMHHPRHRVVHHHHYHHRPAPRHHR